MNLKEWRRKCSLPISRYSSQGLRKTTKSINNLGLSLSKDFKMASISYVRLYKKECEPLDWHGWLKWTDFFFANNGSGLATVLQQPWHKNVKGTLCLFLTHAEEKRWHWALKYLSCLIFFIVVFHEQHVWNNIYLKHKGEGGRKRARMILGCTNKKIWWKVRRMQRYKQNLINKWRNLLYMELCESKEDM